jgi:hypothetical protein
LDDRFKKLTPHGKKMHVKEIYVIFIHLFNSGILLNIDLNKKKGNKGGWGGGNFFCEFYSKINVMFRQFKEKNKHLLRLKLKSALKIEQISVVL